MAVFTKRAGFAPVVMDDTRGWVEQTRQEGKLKPQLKLRVATDSNYLLSVKSKRLYGAADETQLTKAMMNLALPGQRLHGVTSWSATEADQVVNSAQIDMYNCLPVSQTQSTLTSSLEGYPHSSVIHNQYIANSLGVVDRVRGNTNGVNFDPRKAKDKWGYYYREDGVKYRTYGMQSFTIANATNWPDPAIPDDVDNDVPDDAYWPQSAGGVGAYYVQIGSEVVRVCSRSGATFFIPPGGRNIGGDFENPPQHTSGETVKLLGFGPFTGELTAYGYLNVDDFRPQTALLRPGTCIVSYEAWGDIPNLLDHEHNRNRNWQFTGYWFVAGLEPTLDETGIPKIRIDLRSAGWMFDKQRITPDLLRRAKNQFGQWKLGQEMAAANGQSIWGAADHDRNIPGDWVDYNSWDPSLPSSYPLKIKIEVAQHEEFFNHMVQSKNGDKCELCRAEDAEWKKYKDKPGNADYLKEQRAVGRHIYKSSIRVLKEEAGPIKTYIRLMATLAAAAWDHPAYGTELAQAFTKLPNKLWNNMRDVHTGLIWNGQLQINILGANDKDYDWFSPSYSDEKIYTQRKPLSCPYEATYDRTPFSQPMVELAEMNGCTFWVTRKGEPVFKPRLFNYRPYEQGGQWNLSYGGSISSYSPSLNADSIITQVWVTATSAFNSSMTVIAGGTGYTPGGNRRVMYSGLGGNSHGLALTSGVQQVETLSMDNQKLGLTWDMEADGWGAVEERPTGEKQLNALPSLYDGSPAVSESTAKKYPGAVKKIRKLLNFFLIRRYIIITSDPKQLDLNPDDPNWNSRVESALKNLQRFVGTTADGVYGRATYKAVKSWLDNNKHYVQFDIWWYVVNYPDMGWELYLSAITGVPIQMKKNKGASGAEPRYVVSDQATQKEVGEWTKTFARSVINYGGRVVDESIDKSTARSAASNFADPRIQPGDTIWLEVPGHLGTRSRPPYTNGLYVTQVSRQMSLESGGSYTATYSGHRYVGDPQKPNGLNQQDIDAGYAWS